MDTQCVNPLGDASTLPSIDLFQSEVFAFARRLAGGIVKKSRFNLSMAWSVSNLISARHFQFKDYRVSRG